MSKPCIALVTAVAARETDADLPPLEAALRDAGAAVTVAEWDRPREWSGFDLALLRSPWDYPQRLAEFLDWAGSVSLVTRLSNSLPTVTWNSDKHYLRDLERSGVATVPTRFVEPGESAQPGITELLRDPAVREFVVKPAVAGGSQDASRFGREDVTDAATHALRLLAANRSVMIQPYLDRVDEQGETALIFFRGEFSHAIRKGPLLRRKQTSTALFAKEAITARVPEPAEMRLAEKALAVAPFGTPLYARVDLIRDGAGEPVLLELELLEPSLFFTYAPGSAERFAAVVLDEARRSSGRLQTRE